MPFRSVRIPFDTYDFMGYLIPAGMFFVGCVILSSISPAMADAIALAGTITPKEPKWVAYVVGPVCWVMFLYVLGHAIASLSSLVIDKVFVEHCHGYPYESLLRTESGICQNRRFSRYAYTAIFGIGSVVLFTVFYCHCSRSLIVIMLLFIMAVLLAKIGVTYLLHLGKYKKVTWLVDLYYTSEWSWLCKTSWRITRAVYFVLSLPFGVSISFLMRLLRSHRPFPTQIRKRIRDKFYNVFGVLIDDADSDAYWLPYIYVCERSRESRATLHHFLHLYGFSRDLSAAMLMLASIAFYLRVFNNERAKNIELYFLICILLFSVFLVRYYYLYRNYFTKYLYRAFLVVDMRTESDSIVTGAPPDQMVPEDRESDDGEPGDGEAELDDDASSACLD